MCQMCRWAAVLKDLKERYFAGREERSHLSSARGKCVNSKTFHLPGGWVRALLSELGARLEWGGGGVLVKVMAMVWPVAPLRSHWRSKLDYYPSGTTHRQKSLGEKLQTYMLLLSEMEGLVQDLGVAARSIYSCCLGVKTSECLQRYFSKKFEASPRFTDSLG